MTEIQLKNIVDRLGKESVTKTDGDEFTIKNGIKISKFSKEAMEIGPDVNIRLQQKVYDQFTSYVGEDSVFPTKNGSPKILTKFIDHPYSYELLPEYERGEKKMPYTRAMNWEGKTYSSLVIRGFIRGLRNAPTQDASRAWSLCPNWTQASTLKVVPFRFVRQTKAPFHARSSTVPSTTVQS
jgi:hypothetical protein